MKITMFGLTISSSWGNGHATPYRAIIRSLHRLGHQVTFYEKDVEYYALRRDFDSCEYCDLKLYSDWDDIASEAIAEAAESDVAMTASYVPDGAQIADRLLELDRPLRVYYDLDTPVTLKRLAVEDTPYIRRDQIPAFDLVLSWTGGTALEALRTDYGAKLARPLFGCVDPDVYYHVIPRADLRCELSYMGTYAADRQAKLESMFLKPAKHRPYARFLLAGSMYPWEWKWPGNVKRIEHVAPADHPVLYSSSRMTLNITRADMAESGFCPSGRFFEAAACGTPIVSDWFEGLDAFFRPGYEVLVAQDTDEVQRALNLPDADLFQIAREARQRTLDEHTGARRAATLLQYFEQAAGSSQRRGQIMEAA